VVSKGPSMSRTRLVAGSPERAKKSPFQIDPRTPLLADIEAISAKLRRSDRFTKRIAAEGIDMEPKAYFARLTKKKAVLQAKARALHGVWSKRSKAQSKQGMQARVLMQTRAAEVAPRAGLPPNIAVPAGLLTSTLPMPPGLGMLLALLDQQALNCTILEGEVTPSATFAKDLERSINHSSAGGMTIDETFRDTRGIVLANASLNDDARWYRNDNPDHFTSIYEVDWTLPRQRCNCIALCQVFTDQRIQFTDAADDAGSCMTFIATKTTDPQGNFGSLFVPSSPEEIVFNSNDTGAAESGTRELQLAFVVNAGVQGQVALGHGVELRAQDGLVDALMTIRFGPVPLGLAAPTLRYSMIPIS
jgi:hypothetical protein